jgi:hypothetical protein
LYWFDRGKVDCSRNGDLGNFKINGGNQHWNRQLTFWRNFRESDLGVREDFNFRNTSIEIAGSHDALVKRWRIVFGKACLNSNSTVTMESGKIYQQDKSNAF